MGGSNGLNPSMDVDDESSLCSSQAKTDVHHFFFSERKEGGNKERSREGRRESNPQIWVWNLTHFKYQACC